MNLRNLSRGTVMAALTVLALAASAFGKPALSEFLNSPGTAEAVQAVIVGVGVLAAGVMEGVKPAAK